MSVIFTCLISIYVAIVPIFLPASYAQRNPFGSWTENPTEQNGNRFSEFNVHNSYLSLTVLNFHIRSCPPPVALHFIKPVCEKAKFAERPKRIRATYENLK